MTFGEVAVTLLDDPDYEEADASYGGRTASDGDERSTRVAATPHGRGRGPHHGAGANRLGARLIWRSVLGWA